MNRVEDLPIEILMEYLTLKDLENTLIAFHPGYTLSQANLDSLAVQHRLPFVRTLHALVALSLTDRINLSVKILIEDDLETEIRVGLMEEFADQGSYDQLSSRGYHCPRIARYVIEYLLPSKIEGLAIAIERGDPELVELALSDEYDVAQARTFIDGHRMSPAIAVLLYRKNHEFLHQLSLSNELVQEVIKSGEVDSLLTTFSVYGLKPYASVLARTAQRMLYRVAILASPEDMLVIGRRDSAALFRGISLTDERAHYPVLSQLYDEGYLPLSDDLLEAVRSAQDIFPTDLIRDLLNEYLLRIELSNWSANVLPIYAEVLKHKLREERVDIEDPAEEEWRYALLDLVRIANMNDDETTLEIAREISPALVASYQEDTDDSS